MACLSGSLESLDVLLQGGKLSVESKAEHNGWTPLHIATANNNEAMVTYLLAHGANVNAKGEIVKTICVSFQTLYRTRLS